MRRRTSISNAPKLSGHFVAGLYLVFGCTDLFCSLIAFKLGLPELNPIFRWLLAHDLFVPGKLALTVFVGALIIMLYPHRSGRVVSRSGVLLMGAVTAYHLLGLEMIL
jgi:hypothetical protein